MKKWIILTACLGLMTASALPAGEPARPEADREHSRKQGPKHRGLLPARLLEELSLTAEQKTRYDSLSAQFQQERDKLFESNPGQEGNLREEFRAAREKGDEAKLEELRQKRREKAEPFHQLRRKYMEQFRAMLTPEQVAKLDEAKRRMHERHGQFGEHHGGNAPPPPLE